MPRERNADKRHRAEQVLAELDRGYPDAATELVELLPGHAS